MEENFEPEIDDTVQFCPDCETPNQFGELCNRCIRERQADFEDNFLDSYMEGRLSGEY